MVLHANQPVDAYWIEVHGMGACNTTSQVAVIYYEDSPNLRPTVYHWVEDPGYVRNHTVILHSVFQVQLAARRAHIPCYRSVALPLACVVNVGRGAGDVRLPAVTRNCTEWLTAAAINACCQLNMKHTIPQPMFQIIMTTTRKIFIRTHLTIPKCEIVALSFVNSGHH